MAMTNSNMAPAVKPGPDLGRMITEDPLAEAKADFDAQVKAEAAPKVSADTVAEAKPFHELTEEDAYNLNIPINASRDYDPNALKIVMKDSTMIARWCHRNNVRQSQLVAKGFRAMTIAEVENKNTLEMFVDSQGHLVYADLIAMKIRKSDYYAGLRQAYTKSLHSTNNRKASQAGAQFASNNLNQSLSAAEREYLQHHTEGNEKPVYNPSIGV